MTKLARIGAGAVVAGVLAYGCAELWSLSRQHAWRPLAASISLRPGEVRSPEFSVHRTTEYLLMIEFNRGANPERLSCLLDLSPLPEPACGGIPEIDDIAWFVTSGDHPVANGSSRGYHGVRLRDGTVAKYIGDFQGQPDIPYRIRLDVHRDAPELDGLHPRLQVAMPMIYWEQDAMDLEVFRLAALLLIGAGLIAILGSLPGLLNRRRAAFVRTVET